MVRFTAILVAALLALSTAAWGQEVLSSPYQNQNKMPTCSADYDATGTTGFGLQICAGTVPGAMGYVTDGDSATDCTTGGGAYQHVCVSDGDGTFTALAATTSDHGISTATPSVTFDDTDYTDGGEINVNCATDGDCDMDLEVDAGGTMEEAIVLDGVAASDWDVKIGDAGESDYVNITETGAMSFVGAASLLPTQATNAATLDLTALGANLTKGCYQYIVNNDGDADGSQVTLPPAVAGYCITVVATAAQVITIEVDAGDIINLGAEAGTGAALDAGDTIDSPGDIGAAVTLLAINGVDWVTISMLGVWVDGGAT